MNEFNQVPFSNTYWVIPGKFLAGEHPSHYDGETTRKRVAALLRFGVRSIVDLTTDGDTRISYAPYLETEANLYQISVTRKKFPIDDFSAPSIEQMTAILDWIEREIAAGKLVYGHCLAGIGRTGTMVGCFLVNQGYSGEAALERIQTLRSETPTWWQRSPESPQQVDFILKWEHYRPANSQPCHE